MERRPGRVQVEVQVQVWILVGQGRAWLDWVGLGFILFFSRQAPNTGLVVLYYYTEVCLS
jgi:hypothetical protein